MQSFLRIYLKELAKVPGKTFAVSTKRARKAPEMARLSAKKFERVGKGAGKERAHSLLDDTAFCEEF